MKTVDLTRFDFRALRFLKSESIEAMTAEEVGEFVLLMCHAWLGAKNASLPNNPVLLARYARVERLSDVVMREWNEGPDGRLYNETLSEEWDAAVGRSAHGAKGAAALWKKRRSQAECSGSARASTEHCSSEKRALVKPNQSTQTKPEEKTTCSTASVELFGPALITLSLIGGDEHQVTQADLNEWRELYPGVDVMQELRNMKGWLSASPQKRKTRNGIRKFINSWLAREQDRGPRRTEGLGVGPANDPKSFDRTRNERTDAALLRVRGKFSQAKSTIDVSGRVVGLDKNEEAEEI
jgi:uncharacterized protein YdaU (DUF1376 family)